VRRKQLTISRLQMESGVKRVRSRQGVRTGLLAPLIAGSEAFGLGWVFPDWEAAQQVTSRQREANKSEV